MKIKQKFILSFVFFAIVPILILGSSIYFMVQSSNIKDAYNTMESTQKTAMLSIESSMDMIQSISKNISQNDSVKNYMDLYYSNKLDSSSQEQVSALFKRSMNNYGIFENIVLINKDGKCLIDALNAMPGKDLKDMEYYIKTKELKTQYLSKVKKSITTGRPIEVIANPIIQDNGELMGIVLTTVDLTYISQKYIDNIKIGDTGYVYIVESDGTAIAHPKKTEILKKNLLTVNIGKKILDSKKGTDRYLYNGVEKLVAYDTDNARGWTFITTIPLAELTKVSNNVIHLMIFVIILSAIICGILANLQSKNISKSIIEASTAMERVSKGDFTVSLKSRGRDEISSMSHRINETLESLKESIAGVQEIANTVGYSATTLSSTSKEMNTAADEVATAIQNIASGVSTQADELVDVVNLLEGFSEELKIVEENILDVVGKTSDTQSKAYEGKSEIDSLMNSIGSIKEAFENVFEKVKNLSVTVSKIGSITDTINSISEQTNLLALNAAIEAARAGEQGKGFAVVADEVRKLAEESQNSSGEILSLIKSISVETSDVIDNTKQVKELLDNQEDIAMNTIKSFVDIIKSVDDIVPLMEKTKVSVSKSNDSKGEVVNKVQSISAVAEEVSASSEEISASAEELLASTEEVTKLAVKVDGVSSDLRDRVGMFKI